MPGSRPGMRIEMDRLVRLLLQFYIFERVRPREWVDLHQRGFLDTRSEPARPEIIPDRGEPGTLVQDLLQLVQHCLALFRIGFGELLLEELIDIGPAAIGVIAGAGHDLGYAGRGV